MCKHIQLSGVFVGSSRGYDARLFFKLKKKYARVSFIAATAAAILYDFLMHRLPQWRKVDRASLLGAVCDVVVVKS